MASSVPFAAAPPRSWPVAGDALATAEPEAAVLPCAVVTHGAAEMFAPYDGEIFIFDPEEPAP